MAMNTTPGFIGTIQTAFARVAAANTNKDGTGLLTTLIAGAAAGTAIYAIDLKAEVTTAAACVTFFITSGAVTTFWREVLVPVQISSSSQTSWEDHSLRSADGSPLLTLKQNETLKFACTVNQAITASATWAGDF